MKASHAARAEELAAAALSSVNGLSGEKRVAAAAAFVLASPALKGASVSFAVAHVDGKSIFESGSARAQNPCSNAKLATAAYALSVLGPTHRFSTKISVDDGGTLSIKGQFDPTLTSAALADIAHKIAAAGITEVHDIVIDNSALRGSNVPKGFSGYGDQDWEYLARPEPLSINKGALHITIRPGERPGEPARVDVDETTFAVRNRVETVAGGSTFKVGCDEKDTAGVLERDAAGRAIIDVWGTIAADYDKGKSLVMKSPAPVESFADHFLQALKSAGVACTGGFREGSASSDGRMIVDHRSAPLAEILKTSLSTSNAFDHEMFALAAAEKESGGPVSLDDAGAALESFLERTVGADDAVMANGSGIGNENLLAAADVVKLLRLVEKSPRLAVMDDALARPGRKGTLGARMLDTKAEHAVRAKTGTGDVAVALSGFVDGGQSPLVFSFLVDNHQSREGARAALDAMGIVLATLAPDVSS